MSRVDVLFGERSLHQLAVRVVTDGSDDCRWRARPCRRDRLIRALASRRGDDVGSQHGLAGCRHPGTRVLGGRRSGCRPRIPERGDGRCSQRRPVRSVDEPCWEYHGLRVAAVDDTQQQFDGAPPHGAGILCNDRDRRIEVRKPFDVVEGYDLDIGTEPQAVLPNRRERAQAPSGCQRRESPSGRFDPESSCSAARIPLASWKSPNVISAGSIGNPCRGQRIDERVIALASGGDRLRARRCNAIRV